MTYVWCMNFNGYNNKIAFLNKEVGVLPDMPVVRWRRRK